MSNHYLGVCLNPGEYHCYMGFAEAGWGDLTHWTSHHQQGWGDGRNQEALAYGLENIHAANSETSIFLPLLETLLLTAQ